MFRGLGGRAAALVRVLLLVLAVCSPGLARAQSADDRALAEALFDQALKLLDAKDYAAACPKLEESQRLDPGVGTLLYLADCYEQEGRTASAWATFREAGYAAEKAGQAERQKLAQDNAARLKPSLSMLTIIVKKPALGLVIERDGTEVKEPLWGTPVPVDPGTHTIAARAPGKKPWSGEVEVGGEAAQAQLEVPTLEDAPKPPPEEVGKPSGSQASAGGKTSDIEDVPAPGQTQRLLGWITMGVGVVTLAAGGYFALQAATLKSDADAYCRPDDPTLCREQGLENDEDGRSNATLANITIPTGVFAVGVGVALILTAPSADDAKARARRSPSLAGVTPVVGPRGGGLMWSSSW